MFAYRTSISSNGSDNEQEIKGDKELKGKGLAGANGRNGDAAGHEGVKNALKSERSAYGCRNLSCNISRHLRPGKVTERGECDGEGWIKMSSGDVTSG